MKIIIAGGSGFIGRNLERHFVNQGHLVRILTRNPNGSNDVLWDGETLGYWVSELDCANVLINMAGKSVDCRYHQINKDLILSSRINSTSILQQAVDNVKNPPALWINSSTATIYKHALAKPNDEATGVIGTGFSVNVAKAWEKEFFQVENEKIRKVALRTAIVLGKEGGAMLPFLGLANKGLGGFQGSGNQMVSWLHEEDLCKIVDFVIEKKQLKGIVNACAPNPIKNKVFMEELRKAVGVRLGIPTPSVLVKIGTWAMRTEAELVLKSRFVVPTLLIQNGYEFRFYDIEQALKDLVKP